MYQATNNSTPKPEERARTRVLTMMICAFIFIALILGFLFLGTRKNSTAEQTHTTASSMFSFDGAEGWHKGPATSTSMALFSPADHSGLSPCLVSAEYFKGTVNPAAEQSQNRKKLAVNGTSVTNLGDQNTVIRTAKGLKKYALTQYGVTTPDGQDNPVMGGNELGFVQLGDGYLKLVGKCDTADQLPSTIAALKALKFNVNAVKH